MHLHALFDEGNKGQKKLSVEPVFIEIIRQSVGCRDHGHPMIKQRLKQPSNDHRIGDVGDLHLVKCQNADVLGDLCGHRCDGIFDPLCPGGM